MLPGGDALLDLANTRSAATASRWVDGCLDSTAEWRVAGTAGSQRRTLIFCPAAAEAPARLASTGSPAIDRSAQLDWWPVAWSEQAAGGLLTLLAIGFGAGWAITGRLARARVEALAVTLLIAIAFRPAGVIGDPMALLLGLAGGAALIFGIRWNPLTGAEYANGDSARFPQPARTMLIVGNVAFGVVALAYNALTRSESGIELDHYVELGSRLVGTGLLLGAAFLSLGSVLRRADSPASGSSR